MKRTLNAVAATGLACTLACSLPLAACTSAEDEAHNPTQMNSASQSAPVNDAGAHEGASEEATDAGNTTDKDDGSKAAAAMKAAKKAADTATSGYEDVAYTVSCVDGSGRFDRNGSRKYVSASMIKLLILAEFMAQADDGTVDLGGSYTLKKDDIVGGTSHIAESGAGAAFTYDELAKYMICYSDNTATNILIDKLGMGNINARAESLGLENTDLQRKMMDTESGVENHMSTDDACTILAGIANHTISSKEMCKKAEGYLKAQSDSEGLAEGLPGGVAFGHKTGDLDTNRHDAGIVYADKPYVIAFFSRDNPRSTANELMAATSEGVYAKLK